jgi:phosphocarrier protein HPr
VRRSSEADRVEATVVLPAGVDLHARPAADLVRAAAAFEVTVHVRAGEREADAKSLLSVLALGARGGTELTLRAEGPGAAEAVDAVITCVSGFEPEPAR